MRVGTSTERLFSFYESHKPESNRHRCVDEGNMLPLHHRGLARNVCKYVNVGKTKVGEMNHLSHFICNGKQSFPVCPRHSEVYADTSNRETTTQCVSLCESLSQRHYGTGQFQDQTSSRAVCTPSCLRQSHQTLTSLRCDADNDVALHNRQS